MAGKLNLTAFCLILQPDDSRLKNRWTLSYRSDGETGYNVHLISDAYAERLMAILQGAEDEGGFVIPYLSNKVYDAEKIGAGLARAVKSANLGRLVEQDNEAAVRTAEKALAEARERLTETIEAGLAR